MIRCPFFELEGHPGCLLLHNLGWGTEKLELLEHRHCRRGTFITCPIFTRIEEYLAEYHGRPSAPLAVENVGGS